ncbi:MAG: hypothetical protein ACRDYD_12205, partial [Acidimicrobiales bacterium]
RMAARSLGSGSLGPGVLGSGGPAEVSARDADPAGAAGRPASAARVERNLRSMERRLTELERDLARARAERSQLAERNAELLGQLQAAERNLGILRQELDRSQPRPGVRARLDDEEASLLRRLIGPAGSWGKPSGDGRREVG